MIRKLRAAFARSETDKLAAVLDAHRAEQRNAESRLSRLWEIRDELIAIGSEEASSRLEALVREMDAAAQRVQRALRLQSDLIQRLAQSRDGTAARRLS